MVDKRSLEERLGILETQISTSAQQKKETEEQEHVVVENNYTRQEIIDLCRTDLNFLAAVAMPDVFRHPFPPVLLAAWQLLIQNAQLENKFPQLALGIPRGHAKTTLIKLFVLWCILFSEIKSFPLVVGSTAKNAENIIADIIAMLEEPNIKNIFGDWKLGAEKDTQDIKKFGFRGRDQILVALGSGGSIRGLNLKNRRPDIIIFEDIQTREEADSQIQSEALERWMIGTAMKAKSPKGCLFIFVGNMYPTPYSILKKLKNNSTWIKFISGAILADGTALWEALRSKESLLEELKNDIEMNQAAIFFSEVLNDTEVGMNTSVDFSSFPEWEWTENDHPQGKFIIIDPSQGKGKDSDAIGLFEIYDGKIGVREILQEKLSPGNLIRRALVLAIKNNTKLIAVEAMAYQFTLLYWFEEICSALGLSGFVFVPIYSTNNSKNSRIVGALKAMQVKEIYLHPNIRPLVQKQIASWNPMKRDNIDDILDVIAHAPRVLAENEYQCTTAFADIVLDSTAGVVEDNHLF